MDFFPKVLWTMLLNLINLYKMTKIHHPKKNQKSSKDGPKNLGENQKSSDGMLSDVNKNQESQEGGQVPWVGINTFPSSRHVACTSFFSHIIFSIQDGNKICFLFHSNKNQHKDDHKDEHKEGEQKYEHTISVEISMVKEGDIVVSIWDLVGQDEYHAIK